jgi:hypothetical protein
MNTGETTMTPQTNRTASAIIAQITTQGDIERTIEHKDEGGLWTFTAFFTTDRDPFAGMNSRHECCPYTICRLVGAWGEHNDTGTLWAGNREELAARIGWTEVARWEAYAEQGENE